MALKKKFAPNAPKSKKPFWTHLLVLLGEEAQMEVRMVCLEIVLILMQDSCIVCVECAICAEINLDAPNGTPR